MILSSLIIGLFSLIIGLFHKKETKNILKKINKKELFMHFYNNNEFEHFKEYVSLLEHITSLELQLNFAKSKASFLASKLALELVQGAKSMVDCSIGDFNKSITFPFSKE